MSVKLLFGRSGLRAAEVANYCTVSKVLPEADIKNFDEIPGPTRFPIFGSIYLYKLGVFNIFDYHNVLRKLHQKYGPVVREDIGGKIVVHVFDPDDVKLVFNAEGKTPVIPPLQETTQMYRQRKQLSLGLGNTNGEEWYRLRSAVQKMMLRPKEVYHYLPLVDSVAQSFVDKIERRLDARGVASDLRDLVAKWSLESSGMICFEQRLGSFDAHEDLAEKMIQANTDIFVLGGILKLSLPIFKYIQTPKWRRFLKAEDFFYTTATKYVDETINKINELTSKHELKENQYSFLSYLLSRKELSQKDVFIITLSLFGDGLSTTTPTLMFNLYCLASNPNEQENIFAEVTKHVPPGRSMTIEMINNLQLLKAAVKETFRKRNEMGVWIGFSNCHRLYPNGTEISRIIQNDLVLGNYRVPAQTHVDLNQFVNFRSPKYYSDPDKFIPERWLREDQSGNALSKHPYLLIPFGHGTRMCAGRRFAEQDMYTVICRILQRFRLELVNPKDTMEQVYNTLLFPRHPLRIRFVRR